VSQQSPWPSSTRKTLIGSNLVAVRHTIFQVSKLSYPQVKVKVKVSLCFNWAPRHEGVLGEWRYSSIHSLTSALDGGEWSASRPGRFTHRERAPSTHWVGHRVILDAVVKRKIPSPRRESNPGTSIVQPVTQRYTDWTIAALSNRRYVLGTVCCTKPGLIGLVRT
jgi:hypothetical protein